MASGMQNLFKNVLKSGISQQVRFYSRWSHRRPLKVYTPEEYEQVEKEADNAVPQENVFEKYGVLKTTWNARKAEKEDTPKSTQYKSKPKKSVTPLIASNQKSKVNSTTDMLETVLDQDGNFVYTKMKNNDQRVGTLLAEVKSKKEKTKKDLILLEGKRLIREALESGCHLRYILFSRKDEIEYLKPFLPKLGAHLYKMPYQEMQMWSDLSTTPGIMGIFKIPDVENFTPKNPLPLTIICDNIRESGNLGTILRICAAVGCERVLLTKGCVNLWDNKVLRSSMGAHFKLRIHKNVEWAKIDEIISEDATFFIADNKIVSDSAQNPEHLVKILEKIPLLPYYAVDFKSAKQVVLIVGGETLGISNDSYELAVQKDGARLNIPLSNEVDSLNVGAALGVIAFEIKKQLSHVNK